MATNYIAPTWRMPENTNKDKLSNYSVIFSATNSNFIDCGDLTSLSNLNAFSTSIWFKCTDVSSAPVIINGGNSGSNRFYLQLLANGTTIRYVMGGTTKDTTVSNIADGNWHNVATVHDGTSLDIYLDGDKEGTFTTVSPNPSIGNSFTIGRYFLGSQNFFNGNLSQLAIFNYGLSQGQLNYLYNLNNPMAITGAKPIAYYPLGDNSNPRALAGYPNLAVGGSVFDFNSSSINSKAINLGTNTLSFTQNLTISFWIKTSQTVTNTFIAKDNNSLNSGRNWAIYVSNSFPGQLTFWTTPNGSTSNIQILRTNSISVSDNKWHHVVCINDYTNSIKQIWIDNDLEAENNLGAAISNSATEVQIGNRATNPRFPYDGQISNVAFWDTAFTSTQVEEAYNNGAPGDISSLNPVAWYKLNAEDTFNGSDWTIKDYGSSGNDGTSVDMDSSSLVQSNLYRTTPYSNYSINLDGVDYLDFNNASGNLMTNKNAISISGWFKLDSNITGSVFSNWHGGLDIQYLLRYNTGTGIGIQWYIYSNSNTTRIDTNYFPNVGDWVHVVGVKDPITNGGQSRVYINSVEYRTNSTNLSVAIANNSRSDLIGAFKASNTVKNPMNGSISNVAYWTDTALTQAQVTEIYNGGLTTDLNSISGTAPSHWTPMDEKSIYYNGSVIVARDVMNNLIATGVNLIQENIVGNAPGSNANGIGNNLNISNLRGDMSNSAKNSYSINMADYGDPNNQGLTPANSGRTKEVPPN